MSYEESIQIWLEDFGYSLERFINTFCRDKSQDEKKLCRLAYRAGAEKIISLITANKE